ncbi:MAG: glycosyltransferase [Lachnospiraceae bacterium]|nr:glycosyltransferase [Lachnospiraceae bacterium]
MYDHTFVICAYKECHYLSELIESLLAQTVKSEIIIETSTPNAYIKDIADKHGIKVYVNQGKKGITEDWNYAMSIADTNLVTIAHQDDIYLPDYTKTMLRYMEKAKHPLIFFSDYAELRNGDVVKENQNLKVKRFLLRKLEKQKNWSKKGVRRRSLSLGDAICCPSVTYYMSNLPKPLFADHFEASEDWEAWERLSKIDGDFIYAPEILMCHRIHVESATTKVIGENRRRTETFEMYRKFWPMWIAKILTDAYAGSEKSNQI